ELLRQAGAKAGGQHRNGFQRLHPLTVEGVIELAGAERLLSGGRQQRRHVAQVPSNQRLAHKPILPDAFPPTGGARVKSSRPVTQLVTPSRITKTILDNG